jgi:hypothetical protein
VEADGERFVKMFDYCEEEALRNGLTHFNIKIEICVASVFINLLSEKKVIDQKQKWLRHFGLTAILKLQTRRIQ